MATANKSTVKSQTKYSTFIGCDTGVLKGIHQTQHGVKTKVFKLPDDKAEAGNEITTMAWRDRTEKELYTGHGNSTLRLFDSVTEQYIFTKKLDFGSGKVAGIIPLRRNMMVGLASGEVDVVYKLKAENPKAPVKKSLLNTLVGKKSIFTRHQHNLEVVKQHPAVESMFATGGCENDLKIWDIENKNKMTFCARNVANDTLDLRVPVWVSDLTFMQDSRCVAVVSRHSYIRLYDPRAQRKPVIVRTYETSPLTTICTVPNKPGCVVLGTSHGRVTMFDIRGKPKKSVGAVFKGISGAVRALATTPRQPALAYSVSLDRHFRVHNLETKETVHKEYLKSRLTSILLPQFESHTTKK